MGLNKNHEVEEINGKRCAVVEKGISQERVEFLKNLLEFNQYNVEVAASAPPKEKVVVVPALTEEVNIETTAAPIIEPVVPATYNIGVTDLMFNSINAIFGRLLKSRDGHVVTLAYWQQKENISDDEIPYYEHK